MTKQETKAAVTATLRKVDAQELPKIIRQIKSKALFSYLFNKLSEDTFNAINEACDGFVGVAK